MDQRQLKALGFSYSENALLLIEGGSKLHGAKLEGKDDTDWYGLYVEPAEIALGLDEFEHFVNTTGGKPGGNGPDDVDLTLYGLRKFAGPACKGNPSALHFFFANPRFTRPLWFRLAEQRSLFFSRNHVDQFLGYADSQLKRLYNERSKDVNRPELEAAHGYDTKFARHLIRLLGEAKEFVEYGEITLPRPNAADLIQIRVGKYKLSDLIELAKQLRQEASEAKSRSPLPEKVDKQAVSRLIAQVYQDAWKSQIAQMGSSIRGEEVGKGGWHGRIYSENSICFLFAIGIWFACKFSTGALCPRPSPLVYPASNMRDSNWS